jgi:flagellar hook-length control protein FliK
MTNQTPAPKASSATALLASLAINSSKTKFPIHPSTLPASPDEDFSSLILHAISAGPSDKPGLGKNGATLTKQTNQSPVTATNPDPAGLLLSLLLQTAPPPAEISIKQKFTAQPDLLSSKSVAKTAMGIAYHQTSPLADSRSIPSVRGLSLVRNARMESSDSAKPRVAASENDAQPPLEVMTRPTPDQDQSLLQSSDLPDKDSVLAKAAMLWQPVSDQDENVAPEPPDKPEAILPLQAVAVPTTDGVKLSPDWVPSLPAMAVLPKGPVRRAAPVSAIGDSKRARGGDPQREGVSADSKSESPPKAAKAPVHPDASPQGLAPDGTSVAISEQRMNFVTQKNEFAGSAEQNLPLTQAASVPVVDTATDAAPKGAATSLDFFWRETPSEVISMVNLGAKPGETGPSEPISSPASATPATRLEQMISHEAVAIRQTGAQSLGVSLRLDDNTHLFLQLTTHNGTIQASLRCEKGDFSALDSQWSQLQTSLARQNIELLPSAATQSNFQQTSQQQQQQRQFQQQEDAQPANLGVPPTPPRQQKNPNARHSRPDREFWA